MGLVRSGRMSGWLWVGVLMGLGSAVLRGPVASAQAAGVVPVVMLSDLHFDPFHDPSKFDRLRAAPASGWERILAEPDAPTQAADFAQLMGGCKTRGVDSPWTLLTSSLKAGRAQAPHALFVTVSGDLLVHQFECRFKLLAHDATEAEYSAFAAKAVSYVAAEVHAAFPATPVYLALGNNDSGCGDYHESPGSDFLETVGRSFGDDVGSKTGREDVQRVFAERGSYSVALPTPIVRGRLIVLQDIFLSKEYAACNGKADHAPGAAELEWLRTELTAARERHEQVWVMAHIPPGVNVYSTIAHARDVCAGQAPEMFLRDEKLVDVLTDFAPEIRLAIFAHTHMDEMRLLQREAPVAGADGSKPNGSKKRAVVVAKLVPSVTAINGNYPALTVAEVDPATAVMKDYRVFVADNKTGVGAKWSEEYRYSTTYNKAAYTPENVSAVLGGFSTDKEGALVQSAAYESNFMVGGGLRALAMRLVWPQYVCSMSNDTAEGYRGCACPAKP